MGYFYWQLDYIFFFYGLAFLLLAAMCFFLRRNSVEMLRWKWLAMFGLTHGFNEWLDLLAITFVDSHTFTVCRLLLMSVSFLFLFEFGRRSVKEFVARAPGLWIYIPLFLLTASGGFYGLNGLNAAARNAFGLTGGLLSCLAVYLAARGRPAKLRSPLLSAAAGLGLYAFATGLVTPGSGFLLSKWCSHAAFNNFFGFPVQLLRGILAVWIAISVWRYIVRLEIGANAPSAARKTKIGRLTVILFLSILSVGALLTNYIGSWELKALTDHTGNQNTAIQRRIEASLSEAEHAALTMSGSLFLAQALKTRVPSAIENANSVLDRYCSGMGLSVCYLLDLKGVTIASSNRNADTSFVGKSYAFRPYFTSAAGGAPGRYFALGVTSGERGYYAGAPVKDPAGKILGVAVVKKNMNDMATDLRLFPDVFLASPQGIVFISSRKELLFKSLWPVSEADRASLLASQQFGNLSFEAILPVVPLDGARLKRLGADYYVSRKPVGSEGWSVIILAEMSSFWLARFLGVLISAVLCLLTLSFFALIIESDDKRALAEAALRLKEEVSVLSGILPICASCRKIRDDKGYWTRVESYLSKHSDIRFSHGICDECAKKLYPEYAEDKNEPKET